MFSNLIDSTIRLGLWLGAIGLVVCGPAYAEDQPPQAVKKADYPLWDGRESPGEYGKRTGLADTAVITLPNNVKLELVLIPAGRFLMGSVMPERKEEAGDILNELQHPVTLTRPFYMGKYEVTQEQYKAVMGKIPDPFSGEGSEMDLGRTRALAKSNPTTPPELLKKLTAGPLPVCEVSWVQAMEFCEKVGKLAGKGVSLPTEAQWEYACRAGTSTRYNTGNTISPRQAHLHFPQIPEGVVTDYVVSVGVFPPNKFGLYDMHGNVVEWCRDYLGIYTAEEKIDPIGGDETYKGIRGGGGGAMSAARSAMRGACNKKKAGRDFGFRVVMFIR